MAQQCWGIDIGTTAVKAVCLQGSKTGVTVVDSAYIAFKSQTNDKIERISQVRNAVEELVNTKKIGSMPVVVSLMGHNALHKVFELPPVPKNKVAELVGFEARQQIPFDLEDVVWDYQVTSDFVPGEQIEISLFAIKREVIDDFLAVISDFNLNIEALQLNSLAAYNFVAYEKGVDDKPVVMVDMGASNCEFIIVKDGKYYVRKLAISGNAFTSLLSEKFKIEFPEAEELKCNMAASKQAEKLQRVLSPKWRDFVGELQRSLGYYKTIWRDLSLDQAYLAGGSAHLAGFSSYLKSNLGFEATALNTTEAFSFGPGVQEATFNKRTPEMGAAIGLALQGIGCSAASINLMPPALAQAKALKAKRPIVAISLVIMIAALVVSWLNVNTGLEEVKELKTKIDKTIKAATSTEKKFNALNNKIGPMQKDIDYLTEMYKGRNMALDVQNSILKLIKRSNTKFISLKSTSIEKDDSVAETKEVRQDRVRRLGFGNRRKPSRQIKAKKETEIMDLTNHTVKYTFAGRILVGREIVEKTTVYADPKENDGIAFAEPKILDPIRKEFDVQKVDTKELKKRVVDALKRDGRPKFNNVALVDISPKTAAFASVRESWFSIRGVEGIVQQKWKTITTETTEKYTRFEVSWECSE